VSTHYFVVPVEAVDADQAWVVFWDMVGNGLSDERWDTLDIQRTATGLPRVPA
jgi:hypothetical protein